MTDRHKALTELRDAVARGEYLRPDGMVPHYTRLWDAMTAIGVSASNKRKAQSALRISHEACAATIDALIAQEKQP
jgi:hypothetical protein